LNLDKAEAESIAGGALKKGIDPHEMIDQVIKPTADEIGEKFDREEYFLPQLMLSGEALEGAMQVLLSAMPAAEHTEKQTIVIGTVKGDIHSIGKNIVAMMLRTGGFEIHDLGVDIESADFIKAAQEKNADIIALSSLLTTTLPYQREVIEELNEQKTRDRFKVLIGGGPSSRDWAEEIGADGYGKDATEALKEARRITEKGE
jgi:corrinoid protein of di/trimethylamine methyltransferase